MMKNSNKKNVKIPKSGQQNREKSQIYFKK